MTSRRERNPFAAGRRCLRCHILLDDESALDMTDAIPKDGDLSLCYSCGNLAVFSDGTTRFRPLTPSEELRALQDPEIQVAKTVVRSLAEYMFPKAHLN